MTYLSSKLNRVQPHLGVISKPDFPKIHAKSCRSTSDTISLQDLTDVLGIEMEAQ